MCVIIILCCCSSCSLRGKLGHGPRTHRDQCLIIGCPNWEMPRLCRGRGYRYRSREIDVGQFGIKTFTPKKKSWSTGSTKGGRGVGHRIGTNLEISMMVVDCGCGRVPKIVVVATGKPAITKWPSQSLIRDGELPGKARSSMKWLRSKARFVGRCLGKHLNSNEEGLGDLFGLDWTFWTLAGSKRCINEQYIVKKIF